MHFRVFSGYFEGVFRVVSGSLRVFSGCFQGVFPHALCGYALWPLPNSWETGVICVSNSDSTVLRIIHICICVLNSRFRSQNKRMRMYFPVGIVSILVSFSQV